MDLKRSKYQYLWRHFILVFLLAQSVVNTFAQTNSKDTTKQRSIDLFPAISYSPETKLTLGVLGYWYPKANSKGSDNKQSYINFLALYTTANQILLESNWDVFTKGDKVRFRGGLGFARFPNRNYGIGNQAISQVTEYEMSAGQITDSTSTNYKRYSLTRVSFTPNVLWKLKENLYGGVIAELEYGWNLKDLADSVRIGEGKEAIELLENNATGFRSGLGLNLVWDNRDYILSASSGSYVNLSAMAYGRYIGSDYSYYDLLLDARTYLNPVGRHTLAIRGLLNIKNTNDESLPLRGYSEIGGSNFGRGYFNGTYRNNSVLGFQTEYRIPFWKADNLGPIYHYWKRLAMTVFASASQVYGGENAIDLGNMNYAAGAGLRLLFNESTRSYLRVDYAFGLSPNAGGPDNFQRGFYFTFGEAF